MLPSYLTLRREYQNSDVWFSPLPFILQFLMLYMTRLFILYPSTMFFIFFQIDFIPFWNFPSRIYIKSSPPPPSHPDSYAVILASIMVFHRPYSYNHYTVLCGLWNWQIISNCVLNFGSSPYFRRMADVCVFQILLLYWRARVKPRPVLSFICLLSVCFSL